MQIAIRMKGNRHHLFSIRCIAVGAIPSLPSKIGMPVTAEQRFTLPRSKDFWNYSLPVLEPEIHGIRPPLLQNRYRSGLRIHDSMDHMHGKSNLKHGLGQSSTG